MVYYFDKSYRQELCYPSRMVCREIFETCNHAACCRACCPRADCTSHEGRAPREILKATG